MNTKIIFQRLGFQKNAFKVYEALLKTRESLLPTYIAKSAGVTRAEVYRQLPALMERGFLTKTMIGKRIGYQAENPRRIVEVFTKDAGEAARTSEHLAKKRSKDLPQHISYFQGYTGVQKVFDDVIERTPKGETFYRYTSEKDLAKVNAYLSPHYRTLRDKKKLERMVISNPLSGNQKRPRLERFIKYIPREMDTFDQNIIQLVYADSLAFINLSKEEAFIIRDKTLAQFQTVIFKQLYKKL